MNIKEQFGQTFEAELLDEIEDKASLVRAKQGEVILAAGQTIRVVPVVVSGLLKIMRISENDKELLLYYVSSGHICVMAITCCMERHPSEIRAITDEDTEVLLIPVDLVDAWMTRYVTWKSYLMRSIRNRLNELVNTLDQVAFQKLDERLILYLKEKARITGSPLLHVSHEQIAQELATSRVVISRLLKALEDSKKVSLYRNEIRLLSSL